MGSAGGRKSIFITGAASGIGAETARLFQSRGWFCGLYDINEEGLKAVADELGADNCHVARLDVTKRQDWAAAVAEFAKATDGKMHVLFNNAGIGRHGWFEDIPPEEADLIVDINVKGVINGIYAAIPLLKQTQGARIVNTASTAGVVGSPRLAVYSATKFAVRGLTEALDVELSGLGIRCTSLMPWFIDTPILDMGLTEGANVKMSDELRDNEQEVYPVSLAAETAWEAAHGKDVHYMAGKLAKRARFVSRFLPGMMKKQILQGLPPRD
ncbi:MAG: SDR family oxidoreductase [Hyphomonadaceae bacterium]|nr:SDR family oxidoreductase [Hyphomonadaceae bacterium]